MARFLRPREDAHAGEPRRKGRRNQRAGAMSVVRRAYRHKRDDKDVVFAPTCLTGPACPPGARGTRRPAKEDKKLARRRVTLMPAVGFAGEAHPGQATTPQPECNPRSKKTPSLAAVAGPPAGPRSRPGNAAGRTKEQA